MPWKTMDLREQRVKFVAAASRREKPFSALCEEFRISRPSGDHWLQRFCHSGVSGIAEQSRRPHASPRQTGAELEQQVVELRQRDHSGLFGWLENTHARQQRLSNHISAVVNRPIDAASITTVAIHPVMRSHKGMVN
jgi:hypothetical protein